MAQNHNIFIIYIYILVFEKTTNFVHYYSVVPNMILLF